MPTSASEVGFRGPQVCKIVGITYRQLDYWARTDLVRPSVQDAVGSGSQRLYSYRDLLELKIIKTLLDNDVSLPRVRAVVEELRRRVGEDQLGSVDLVIQGNRVLLVEDRGEIVELLSGGQSAFTFVTTGPMKKSLDAAVHEHTASNKPNAEQLALVEAKNA